MAAVKFLLQEFPWHEGYRVSSPERVLTPALVLYPEGERSIDGTPKIFKKGAAILSIHLQVPIVPVAIEGFYEAWPRNQNFRGFKPLQMVFGDPIFPPPESEASEDAYAKLTAGLKTRIVEMWEGLRKSS